MLQEIKSRMGHGNIVHINDIIGGYERAWNCLDFGYRVPANTPDVTIDYNAKLLVMYSELSHKFCGSYFNVRILDANRVVSIDDVDTEYYMGKHGLICADSLFLLKRDERPRPHLKQSMEFMSLHILVGRIAKESQIDHSLFGSVNRVMLLGVTGVDTRVFERVRAKINSTYTNLVSLHYI
jgi:hypothetical protein